jgi:hypothetical protein
MESELDLQVRRGLAYCRVLLANGSAREKMALKIPNQDYPEKRDFAVDWIIRQVISAEVARQVMNSGRLYADGMSADHDRKCREVIENMLARESARAAAEQKAEGAA